MPEWENVVQGMIDSFGSDAQTVGVLLGFLKCLVEESGNPRIAISVRPPTPDLVVFLSYVLLREHLSYLSDHEEKNTDRQSEQARTNLTHMISGNAESVLGVLAMYIQAQGKFYLE